MEHFRPIRSSTVSFINWCSGAVALKVTWSLAGLGYIETSASPKGSGLLLSTRITAASACTKPKPVLKSNPRSNPGVSGLSMSIAFFPNAFVMASVAIAPWVACTSRAATAATCGAAALVPKKLGKPSPSKSALGKGGKKVVLIPSGPVISGFFCKRGLLRRLPLGLNRIGVPPSEVVRHARYALNLTTQVI